MTTEYPETKAKNDNAKRLIVMLHGVGSDGNDLINLAPYIQNYLPDCHFISPNGVEPYDMAPFGYQWFSLKDRSPDIIMKQVNANAPKLEKIIKHKQLELELGNEETILFGFSQGTMLASYLTLSQQKPYAAMIGFSGRLLVPNKIENKATPFCFIHGADDSVVPAEESEKAAQYCRNNNIENQLLIVPNLTHSIDGNGIQFAIDFINNTGRG